MINTKQKMRITIRVTQLDEDYQYSFRVSNKEIIL